jgi:endonuclease/exonuclease/phosphatase family metal-dependent hydrolase
VTVRVMTWNLWWRFGPFEQRVPAIIETIRSVDPDIICLQEVWSDDRRDVADEIAAALGMHAVRTDPVVWNGESFGNAILARWPVERIASLPLPNAAGEPGHRRIVAAQVETPWGAWPIASTHLDHRFDASGVRQDQVRRLLELGIEWRGDPASDLPLIVGADLNAVPDSDEMRLLTGRSPGVDGIVCTDVWEQVGNGPGHTWRAENPYSTDSAWPNRRLDYLLVSWPRPKPVGNPTRVWNVATAPVEVDGEMVWASDHAAVVADFVTPQISS